MLLVASWGAEVPTRRVAWPWNIACKNQGKEQWACGGGSWLYLPICKGAIGEHQPWQCLPHPPCLIRRTLNPLSWSRTAVPLGTILRDFNKFISSLGKKSIIRHSNTQYEACILTNELCIKERGCCLQYLLIHSCLHSFFSTYTAC